MIIFSGTITAATTVTGSTYQLRMSPAQLGLPAAIVMYGVFAFGSGGTTCNAYLQTSLDGGSTWVDAINMGFLVASANKIACVSCGDSSPNPAATTDGTLVVNTSKDGFFGPLWRVKVISTGTYAGGTTLNVYAFGNGLVPSS